MSCLPLLPEDVLKMILDHLTLQERLGSCSLVSRRMHAAAVAVTQKIWLYAKDELAPAMEQAESIIK